MKGARTLAVGALMLAAACGDRPTLTMRYTPATGSSFHYNLEQEVAMRMDGDSFPGRAQQTLTIIVAFTQTVKGPAEGGTEVRLRVDSVGLSSPELPPQAMASAGAVLQGLETAIVFNERMQSVRSEVTDAGGAPPQLAAQISSSLRGASFPLPEGPIRVGQSWTVDVPAPTGQVPGLTQPLMLSMRQRLESFRVAGTDTIVTIAIATSFPKEPIRITLDSTEATLQLSGTLSGDQDYSLARHALLRSNVGGTVRTTTKGPALGENVVVIDQRMTLTLVGDSLTP